MAVLLTLTFLPNHLKAIKTDRGKLTRRPPRGIIVNMENETKLKLAKRLKVIEGQVRGLQKMIAEDKYCIDIITQSSAIRSSIGSFEDIVLENHLLTCAKDQMSGTGAKKATAEIISVYKLAKKK